MIEWEWWQADSAKFSESFHQEASRIAGFFISPKNLARFRQLKSSWKVICPWLISSGASINRTTKHIYMFLPGSQAFLQSGNGSMNRFVSISVIFKNPYLHRHRQENIKNTQIRNRYSRYQPYLHPRESHPETFKYLFRSKSGYLMWSSHKTDPHLGTTVWKINRWLACHHNYSNRTYHLWQRSDRAAAFSAWNVVTSTKNRSR